MPRHASHKTPKPFLGELFISTMMRWLIGQCSWTTTLGHIEPELYNILYSKRLFRQFHDLRCRQTWTLEKQPQTIIRPPPKAVVPKMWLSWNEVFRWRQTLARPSVGRSKKTTFIRRVDPSPRGCSDNKGDHKITELRAILQRESQNSYVYKQTKQFHGLRCCQTWTL
jgi:hypothetical protein